MCVGGGGVPKMWHPQRGWTHFLPCSQLALRRPRLPASLGPRRTLWHSNQRLLFPLPTLAADLIRGGETIFQSQLPWLRGSIVMSGTAADLYYLWHFVMGKVKQPWSLGRDSAFFIITSSENRSHLTGSDGWRWNRGYWMHRVGERHNDTPAKLGQFPKQSNYKAEGDTYVLKLSLGQPADKT